MDFSLNVDPSLQSTSTSTSPLSPSSLEFFTQHDSDLFPDGLFSPSMVYQTIEPSQLTDTSSIFSPPSSPSPSPSQTRSPSPTSDISVDSSYLPSRRIKRLKAQNALIATKPQAVQSYAHEDSPYDKDHQIKRHQTKLACTWCRKLSKKCDTQRPCTRCVQFNRCSECIDAPPRKARVKGVDRGTYKKTRDLAVLDYRQAVSKREAYVARQTKIGRVVKVGLTAEEILEKARKEEARNQKESQRKNNKENENMWLSPFMGDVAVSAPTSAAANVALLQGGSMPFTGPLEELFTCSASSETEELSSLSPPNSPADSLFDVSSPSYTSSVTDYDESDLTSWHWQTADQFPNVMELVAAVQAAEAAEAFDLEELQRWSDLALVA